MALESALGRGRMSEGTLAQEEHQVSAADGRSNTVFGTTIHEVHTGPLPAPPNRFVRVLRGIKSFFNPPNIYERDF